MKKVKQKRYWNHLTLGVILEMIYAKDVMKEFKWLVFLPFLSCFLSLLEYIFHTSATVSFKTLQECFIADRINSMLLWVLSDPH